MIVLGFDQAKFLKLGNGQALQLLEQSGNSFETLHGLLMVENQDEDAVAARIKQEFENQIQTTEDGRVVGDNTRTGSASTFPWHSRLPAFFAKHDKGRLTPAQIDEMAETYTKNPDALAESLKALYGEDPRSSQRRR